MEFSQYKVRRVVTLCGMGIGLSNFSESGQFTPNDLLLHAGLHACEYASINAIYQDYSYMLMLIAHAYHSDSICDKSASSLCFVYTYYKKWASQIA